MKQTITFIALRTVRVNDSTSILGAYSLEAGRLSFSIGAGAGREARRRRALLMPLSVVECQADIRPGRDIHFMAEPRPLVAMELIYSNPVKNAVALFLAEVLAVVLRECVADRARFAFIASAVKRLAECSTAEAANFHICFLLRLGRFLGIEPDYGGYRPGMVFDLTDGVFRRPEKVAPGGVVISADESRAISFLSRMTFDNLSAFRLSRVERNRIIGHILDFYTLHVAPLNDLRTLPILQTLF